MSRFERWLWDKWLSRTPLFRSLQIVAEGRMRREKEAAEAAKPKPVRMQNACDCKPFEVVGEIPGDFRCAHCGVLWGRAGAPTYGG